MVKFVIQGLFFVCFLVLNAQHKHEVKAKETLYGIAKEYGVKIDDIKKVNVFLNDRDLKIGDVVVIPGVKQKTTNTIKTQSKIEEYNYITIEPKQTVYSLSKEYKILEETIKSLNPNIKEGLKIGDIIRIPKSKVVPKGKHLVAKGETIYAISKLYKISTDELYALNRELQSQEVKEGMYINIPEKDSNNTSKDILKLENGNFIYTATANDTAFSIINKYNITLEELTDANPEITKGIKEGMSLKIPLIKEAKSALTGNYKSSGIKSDTINITLLLPFGANKSATALTENSVDFLAGTKLALDSLAHQGKKISLKVVDSGDENEFGNIIASYNFADTNLIIGPFFKSNLIQLANQLQKVSVPIVSPISTSEELHKYKNIIIAETQPKFLADKIISEIGSNYQNQKIYLMTSKKDIELANYMKKQLEDRLKDANVIIVTDFTQVNCEKNVMTEQYENIITILVSDQEALGNSYVEKLKLLPVDNVKAYGVFYVNAFEKSENRATLQKVNLVFTTERKINKEGINEKNTLKKYKQKYCDTPSKYGVMGFDIVYDLVSRINSSTNLTDNLSQEKLRLGSKYSYEKTEYGSYLNKGLRVVRYSTE